MPFSILPCVRNELTTLRGVFGELLLLPDGRLFKGVEEREVGVEWRIANRARACSSNGFFPGPCEGVA